MAVAIEELTPAAQAVAARLHPGVKAYLEAKAGKQAADAADKAAARRAKAPKAQGGQTSASRSQSADAGKSLQDAATFERRLNAITPGRGISRGSAGGRLVTALFVGVLVLEVLSYTLGQPFSFNLKTAGQKIGDLSKIPYRPLFAGQDLSKLQPISPQGRGR